MTPTKNESLPELPEPAFIGVPSPGCKVGYYTTFQMQEYARAALTREAPTEGVDVEALHAILCSWEGGQSAIESMAQVSATMGQATPPAPQRLAQGEDHKCLNPHWPCHHPSHTQPPHHDRGEVERRARELLANEMGRFSHDEQNRVPLEYALRAITAALTEAKQQGPGEAVATFYAAREGSFIDLNNIDWGRWQLTSKEYHDQCVADPVRMPSNGQAGRICEAVALYTAPQVEAKRQAGEVADHG